jgi:hypothetical protein
MKHEVILKPGYKHVEEFETNNDNIAKVRIFNKQGQDITNQCTVSILLTKNALIGLGSELIRLAYAFEDGKHSHLEPMTQDNVVQDMGIILVPNSAELIITCADLGTVADYKK